MDFEDKRIEELRACSDRILARAKTVCLNDDQYAVFDAYQKNRLNNWLSSRHHPPIARVTPAFYLWLIYFYFLAILADGGACGVAAR